MWGSLTNSPFQLKKTQTHVMNNVNISGPVKAWKIEVSRKHHIFILGDLHNNKAHRCPQRISACTAPAFIDSFGDDTHVILEWPEGPHVLPIWGFPARNMIEEVAMMKHKLTHALDPRFFGKLRIFWDLYDSLRKTPTRAACEHFMVVAKDQGWYNLRSVSKWIMGVCEIKTYPVPVRKWCKKEMHNKVEHLQNVYDTNMDRILKSHDMTHKIHKDTFRQIGNTLMALNAFALDAKVALSLHNLLKAKHVNIVVVVGVAHGYACERFITDAYPNASVELSHNHSKRCVVFPASDTQRK